jgi:hypothetical protein
MPVDLDLLAANLPSPTLLTSAHRGCSFASRTAIAALAAIRALRARVLESLEGVEHRDLGDNPCRTKVK